MPKVEAEVISINYSWLFCVRSFNPFLKEPTMGENPQWVVFWNTAARILRRIYLIYPNRTATDGVISDSWSCGKQGEIL
jgi:hypothetical protein